MTLSTNTEAVSVSDELGSRFDAILARIEEGDFYHDYDRATASLTTLREVSAALSCRTASTAGGVEVKALEWQDTDVGGIVSNARGYRIERGENDRFYARSSEASNLFATIEFASSLDEAKAVCQADFNQRILSSLAGEDEPVAWQWSDFSGKWYTVDTARISLAEQEELARAVAKERGGRVRPCFASTPVSAEVTVTDAVRDVLAERRRQVEDEGWTPEHDDTHVNGEMARASGLYALIAGSDATTYRNAIGGYALNDFASAAMRLWPWSPEWFKPKDRRRDMVKSVALGIAEIERLDRAALATLGGGRG